MAQSDAGTVRSEDERSKFLRFPVMAEGAEYLVMGNLMRRNILTYKAPPLNEGYDLIGIHPNPRHRPRKGQRTQVRIQVKSRYQTDAHRGFPLNEKSLDAFDFLVVVFLNIGRFYGGRDGTEGASDVEYFTLPRSLIKRWHDPRSSWQKVVLRGRERTLEKYRNESGFEVIADKLGVPRPSRL